MLLALARCIYEIWYRPEMHVEKGEVLTFDNRCSSSLEQVACVLQRTGFTRYVDDIGRRSIFNVGPDGFSELADAAQGVPISDNEIENAVVTLASGIYTTSLEIKKLAEMIAIRS